MCAAQTADKYSLAGAVGTIGKQGFFANVFNGVAGNSVSGAVLLFSGNGNKYRFGTSLVNAPPPVGFAATANAINAVTTPAATTELNLTGVGEFANFAGDGLGGLFTFGKLAYDIGSFGVAYYECGKQQ